MPSMPSRHTRPSSAILVTPDVRRTRPPLTAEMLAHVSVIGLFLLALIAALWFAQAIIMPAATAIILGLVLGPMVDRLGRLGLAEPVGAGLVVAAAVVAVHGVLALCALPLLTWIDRAPEVWSAVREKLEPLKSAVVELVRLSSMVERATGLDSAAGSVSVAGPGVLSNVASAAPALVAQLVIFAATLYFFLATRRDLRRAMLGLCLSRRARLTAARVLADSERVLSHYFAVITLINIGLGAATALVAALFGLPSPGLWGVLAAVLNFAPYIGPAILAAIVFSVGLASLDSLWTAALLVGCVVALDTIEGQFITPAVLGRRMTLNPLLIFLAIGAWLWLWGPLGAFIAVPSLLIGSVLIDRLAGRSKVPAAGRRSPAAVRDAPARVAGAA